MAALVFHFTDTALSMAPERVTVKVIASPSDALASATANEGSVSSFLIVPMAVPLPSAMLTPAGSPGSFSGPSSVVCKCRFAQHRFERLVGLEKIVLGGLYLHSLAGDALGKVQGLRRRDSGVVVRIGGVGSIAAVCGRGYFHRRHVVLSPFAAHREGDVATLGGFGIGNRETHRVVVVGEGDCRIGDRDAAQRARHVDRLVGLVEVIIHRCHGEIAGVAGRACVNGDVEVVHRCVVCR